MRFVVCLTALAAVATTSAAQAPNSSMPDVTRQHRERVTCHNAYDALVALQKRTGGNGASAEDVRWAESYEANAVSKTPCPVPLASARPDAINRTISNMETVNRLVKYYAAGDPTAMFELGQASFDQTIPDMTQQNGVELFQKAAAAGDPDGLYMMARLYLGGQFGTKQDWKGAAPFMERAAKAGHVDAMMFYALMQYEGVLGRKDQQAAFTGFSQAAERGHVYATYMAAWQANNGEGTKKDHVLAYRLARNLAAQGEPAAGAVLAASALLQQKDAKKYENEVLYWMDVAIREGDQKVRTEVGKFRPQVVALYQKMNAPPEYRPRVWKACPMKTVCLVNTFTASRSCTTNKDYWSDCDG